MTASEGQIAWTALREGTAITAVDGAQVGKVADVVADREKDIFSGVTLRSGLLEGRVFVPADAIAELTSEEVRLKITAVEVERLESYEG